MICAKCGKGIRDEARFCPYCGEAQNVITPDTKEIPRTISVGVNINNIRLNISSVDKNVMDGINELLTAQLSNNVFFSQKTYGFIQSTGYYHIDWFMPLDVNDPFGWEDFLCSAYKAVSTHLFDSGFRYFPDRRLFEKDTRA